MDRSSGSPKLVINPTEASKVIQIFKLYLEFGSLLPVVKELVQKNWLTKGWTTRFGKQKGNFPFDKCRLHNILTNVIYIGKIRHKKEIYAGEHEAIIENEVFQRVQDKLRKNGRAGNSEHRNRHGALLRGLIVCKACQKTMSHTFTCKGKRRYRYYVCTNAVKQGRHACPSGALPAGEIEKAVVEQIRCIGEDPALVAGTLKAATTQANEAIKRLTSERAILERGISRCHVEIKRIATKETTSEATTNRIADLYEQIGQSEKRKTEIGVERATIEADLVSEDDVVAALADFDTLWSNLSPKEQAKVIELLVRRVEYDAAESEMEVSFHACGIKALQAQIDEYDAVPAANDASQDIQPATPRQAKRRKRAAA
ncbi:MAG: recombinase zinc beta ribbon domain-containing protein [Planctomycetes bacterium]|nr:recombinase zinc beta ribbon domain-containing protein [Planctomycetota bacterium]